MTLCSSKAALQSPPSSIGSGSRLLSEQMRTRSRTERAASVERPMDGAPDRRRGREDLCSTKKLHKVKETSFERLGDDPCASDMCQWLGGR